MTFRIKYGKIRYNKKRKVFTNMKNTNKITNERVRNITSREFIIEFLESIEQPLSEKQIQEILQGTKYLNELLENQKEVYGF